MLRLQNIKTRLAARPVPFYGWAVVLVAAGATFASGPGQSYVFAIFVDPILHDLGLSRTTLSSIYTVGTGVSAGMVYVVSRLVDRFGPRYMLLLIAVALGSACFGMAFAAGPLGLFVGFAALRALGQGSLPVTATLLTAQWFVRYRGRAMAIVSLGFALSNAVLPPTVRQLIDVLDWRGAYIALGVMVWLLLIPGALWVVRDKPEDLSLHPDGAPTAPPQEAAPEAVVISRAARQVLCTQAFWLLALPLTAAPFIITALVFHQVAIFREQGLGPEVAAGVFVVFAGAGTAMGALAGFLIERVGPQRLLLLIQGLLLGALVQGQVMATPGAAVLYAAILGAASGVQGITSSVAWAHYYGRRELGRVQGAAGMVMIAGAALAPLPLAILHQAADDYGVGLTVLAAIPISCAILASLIKPTRLQEQGT
jgi:MFS family permease